MSLRVIHGSLRLGTSLTSRWPDVFYWWLSAPFAEVSGDLFRSISESLLTFGLLNQMQLISWVSQQKSTIHHDDGWRQKAPACSSPDVCVWGGLAIHVPHQVLGQHQRIYLQISEAQQEQQLPWGHNDVQNLEKKEHSIAESTALFSEKKNTLRRIGSSASLQRVLPVLALCISLFNCAVCSHVCVCMHGGQRTTSRNHFWSSAIPVMGIKLRLSG